MRLKNSVGILTVVSIFVFAFNISAQNWSYGGIGYNMASLKSEGLDFVIDRYNETRPYLDDKMEHCHFHDGVVFKTGVCLNRFFVETGFTYRSGVVSASGVDASGNKMQRDLKNKWNTFDFGLGICVANSENMSVILGVNIGLNSEKTLTRADSPDKIRVANFEKVNSAFKAGFEPFLQLLITGDDGFGIAIRPYYSMTPTYTDYYRLNTFINPYTYANDPIRIKGKLTGFGLSIMLIHRNTNL